MSNQESPAGKQANSFRPRFSWPMRFFLFIVIFDIAFHSLAILLPYQEWCDEFDLRRYPRRLPTQAELAKIAGQPVQADEPYPVPERIAESMDSVWEYLKPWPAPEARRKIHTYQDGLRFAVCWLTSRLGFAENLAGINQDWQMFSPNVSRRKYITRSRLVYADSSTRIVRQLADPEDLTHYSHWFEEKILDYELNTDDGDSDCCHGYCNYLSHKFATNDKGSTLKKIELFWVRYDFAPPGVDAMEFYQKQNGPPPSQVGPTFFVYDVKTRKGRMLE